MLVMLTARATIHLPGGLVPGEVYWVDPDSLYVQECFAHGLLVPEDAPETAQEPAGDAAADDPADHPTPTVTDV